MGGDSEHGEGYIYTFKIGLMLTFSQLGNMGRLGNQMFQIASTIGIATKHSHDYVFPRWKYQYGFETPLPLPKGYVRIYSDIKEPSFSYSEIEIPENGVYNLVGYLQSPKYFEHCERLIKKYFTFGVKFPPKVHTSIHVRRGDYLWQEQNHPVLPMSYYKEAMSHFSGSTFLIFSDDIEWCKKQDWFGEKVLFSPYQKDEVADLSLMASCENHIIANSSFSWWGAYLGQNPDKKVIAPSLWFGPKLPHDTKDLLPETWIRI